MSLVVCKFGGTSVASPERIKMVANKLIAKKKAGDDVVAVVSAMGKTTDELVGLANALNTNPPARELDRLLSTGEQVSMTLLAMALEAQGYHAMSFTGRQAGIRTDGTHNKAKIVSVRSDRIMETVDKGIIPVIAGFQGIDDNDDMTTLGRGGSDTTAVAVAWGINADVCEIYSDVEGVFTADPRVCPRAKKLDQISYDDMLELAGAGAGVLQMRAVEFARKWNVVIHSRSAFSDAEGTYIKCAPEGASSVAMSMYSGLYNLGIGTGTWLGGVVTANAGIGLIGYVGGVLALVGLAYCCLRFVGLLRQVRHPSIG